MREFKKLPLELFIGYDIEQNSRVIELDASEMVEKYPSGILQLVCKRPGEETTYIAPSFEQDGGTLRWTLTSYDVEKAGQGLAIVALVDTSEESVKVLASHKIRTGIEEGLHFRDAETVDPEDSLIARVLAAVSQAQAYAQDAKEEADRAEAAGDAVEDAKDQAISAIETKGAETLDSIPADYTTLSNDVSDLKSALDDLADTQTKSAFDQTVSGTGVLDVTGLNIPAGTYNLHIDSVESSDTSGTTSAIVFYGSSSPILSIPVQRNIQIDREITLSSDVTHIFFYAAGGWNESQGKTFSFNGFKIYTNTGLGERLDTLEDNVDTTNATVEAVEEDVAFIKQNILETVEEKWCDGAEAEGYTSSTFSGFSSSWDIFEDAYVKDIQVKVRSRDTSNITKVKVRIESGIFVFEKTYDVNVGADTQTLTLLINKNIPAGTVWFAVAANKICTFVHANDGRDYTYRYWTNGDISDLSGLKNPGGSTKRLWIIADLYSTGNTQETELKCANIYDLVVGDTFQLFYKGVVDAVYPENCYVIPNCSKGSSFERLFQITPNTAETLALNLSLYDSKHHKMDEQNVSLVIHNKATSPQSSKNVLCVGDSLTVNGVWPAEMFRRLTGTGGNPVGDGLSNISFIGTMTKDGVGYEGYGGWKFSNYNTASVDGNAKVITCTHDKTDDDQHSIYKDANNCEWKIETVYSESIKIIAVSTNYGNFPATGTLTWVSGGVNHSNIVYTASQNAPGNPFWDSTANKVDFSKYATNLGVSSIDYVYVLLGWNDAATSEDAYKAQAQTFIDNVHASFPNAKIVLMGLQIPARDGLGVNYGATGIYSNYYELMQYVHNLDSWYDDLAAANTNVYHINISGQFDTEHNMQTGTRTVNTRNSDTETYQTNGVHPAESGYLQIADAAYRSITGLL